MTGLAASRDETPSALVELAARGDEAAFARLIHLHHADMTRVAYVVCGDALLAEDAVAGAWPIAWRRLRSLREPGRVRSWLVAIAANEARQLIRSQRRRAVVELESGRSGAAPFGDPAGRAADIDLADALGRLPAEDRTLLALRYVAGLNASELAAATNLSPSGVRTRLARLLGRLRSELGDD